MADDVENDAVTELTFWALSGENYVKVGTPKPTVEDGDTYTITNGTTATLIEKVTYSVNGGTPEILKNKAENYFKDIPTEGGDNSKDDLMVYKS